MPPIRFRLLGLPGVEQAASLTPLAASRPSQLLAHLLVTGAWQGREHLAQLFWPDSTGPVARSNLRNLLCKLPPFATLESTPHALRLKAPSDLDDFEAALRAQDWEAAVQLGAADLLQGFEHKASERFVRWLRAEREARLARWKQAVQHLLAQTTRPLEEREAWAGAWAQRCPLDEDAAQACVSLAQERHKPAAAEAIYRAFELRLRRELGVGPSVELERQARPLAAPAAPARAPLIGRRLELRQLAERLKDGSTQLLTLTGPGGVGKSTLLAAFHRQWVDEGGSDAFLLDVSAAPDAQGAVAAMAAALGVSVPPGEPAEAALADALGERRWLLLIDGAEQAGLATPLAFLLARCPQTRWIVASRQRLHLDHEQLLVLDGFPLPDAEESDPELLGANDGVRCLADAIARAGRPLKPAQDAMALAAIVRAVDGLPLALRLLGKLTHLFSLDQLLDGLRPQARSKAPTDDALTLSELLPSLLASFQRSWASLSPTEQAVLARLAVFPADFEIGAARWVARTELALLTSLVDRSLLRAMGAGRLSLHAAIRSCVLALEPQPAQDAVADFLAFYSERLRGLASLARTRTVRPLQQFVDQERVHLDRAWALALERRDHATLLSLQESVWFLDSGASSAMHFSARCVEAERLTRDDASVPAALRALLLACVARDALSQRRSAQAGEFAREALRLAQRARHFDASLLALNTWFYASMVEKNYEQAERLRVRQEALLQRVDEGVFAVWAADSRAFVAVVVRGDLEAGMAEWARCASLAHEVEDFGAEVQGLISIAMSCHRLGAHERAIPFEEQAFAVGAAAQVDPSSRAKWLSELTLWHIDLGHLERARAYMEQAVRLSGSHPQMQILRLKVRLAQAAVAMALGALSDARQHLAEVLDALRREDLPAVSGTAFVSAAQWFRLAGQRPSCIDTLHEVLQNRASNFYDLKLARAMLAAFGEPPEGPAVAPGAASRVCQAAALARQRMQAVVLPASP